MTTQQNADRLLLVFQGNKHLPAPLRERAIDEAILAANSNYPCTAAALYHAQQAAVAATMGMEDVA